VAQFASLKDQALDDVDRQLSKANGCSSHRKPWPHRRALNSVDAKPSVCSHDSAASVSVDGKDDTLFFLRRQASTPSVADDGLFDL